ncbi:MAG: membrane protein insertase YidC [Proteobacteria bacterium]|nr:membrane protein insertase YidC [Pseudomonadota bacterium]MBU1737469.1 membrane protein insertase YidC [Pseudomonadota bacterium]
MDNKNALLAIMLSMAVLFGYQLLFPPQQQTLQNTPSQLQTESSIPASTESAPQQVRSVESLDVKNTTPENLAPQRASRDIRISTALYDAVFTENGGTIKSFRLKEYRENNKKDSGPKELVTKGDGIELPLFFSWGTDPSRVVEVPFYESDSQILETAPSGLKSLVMTTRVAAGLTITKTVNFSDNSYLLDLSVDVANTSDSALQGSPYLALTSNPFSPESANSSYLFSGPAVLVGGSLEEVKVKDLKEDGPKTLQGNIAWTGYEDSYFLLAAAPQNDSAEKVQTVRLSVTDGTAVNNVLSGSSDIIPSGASKQYKYTIFFGPKKMSVLEHEGHEFNRAINFGWFGFVAKPLLLLMNMLYGIIHNYGVAIILVTVLIKVVFWPLSHKGMKSMKNMQKMQPQLAKIREKYKDDKEKQAQEQMRLYKTHKINPLGGCMPMILQIPVFFALYRVLMQAIELRHAPFMLWITDLSAPERLSIGFDIPYLGGLPLLTLLMGGSMFLQQKMTPTPATNPETAKVMMLMPVIFTFLFINFASGLVLYFFVNNMLQMAQQHMINRQ